MYVKLYESDLVKGVMYDDEVVEDKKLEMVDAITNILSEIRNCPAVDPEIQKITNEHFWDMI